MLVDVSYQPINIVNVIPFNGKVIIPVDVSYHPINVINQWDFQDPKRKLRCTISLRLYELWGYSLKFRHERERYIWYLGS
jgi:hypothetical protein